MTWLCKNKHLENSEQILCRKCENIGRNFKDKEGNTFSIAECHSGFVWLRGLRGMKQIGTQELKYYTEVF